MLKVCYSKSLVDQNRGGKNELATLHMYNAGGETAKQQHAGIMADPQGYGHEGGMAGGHKGGEAAKARGAGVMADPQGYGHKGGETAKARGAGVMADPQGYGHEGGKATGGE
jgi:hypothetical protein